MFELLFFGIPIIFVLLLLIFLNEYISLKKQNKVSPGTVSDNEIKKYKIAVILLSVIVGVFVAIGIFLIILLSMAVAYM